MSALNGADLTKRLHEISVENGLSKDIERPEGKDAATFSEIGLDVPKGGQYHPGTTQDSPGSVSVLAPQAKINYQFVVYWASPTSPSKDGLPTLRDHEMSHVATNRAIVSDYNSRSKPTTLPVSRGSGPFEVRANARVLSFARGEAALLREIHEARHSVLDDY